MARGPRVVPFPGGPQLRPSANGNPIIDFDNALIAIRSERAAVEAFQFDEMLQTIRVVGRPPLAPHCRPGASPPRLITPEDYSRMQAWLQHAHLPRLGRETVEYAVELIARERSVHPLRDWLNSLEWDGVPRLATFLQQGLGCPDDEYHRQIGAMFLIAMVARVMQPGCQCDYMIVLEGPQGELKSRFCRMLAGDEYFSDNLPHLERDHVRVSMHLRGKWLIEISELSAFSKAEAGALKAFLTRREEIYTPKYGRTERTELRQGVFVGTTNDDDYIRDDTGGRRFWPVKVHRVDLQWLGASRDQLFAEAMDAYRMGRPHWPDRVFEKTVIVPIQAERQLYDAWTDSVLRAAQNLGERVTIAEIFEDLASSAASQFNAPKGGAIVKLGKTEQMRIAAILKKDGYRKAMASDGKKIWRKPE